LEYKCEGKIFFPPFSFISIHALSSKDWRNNSSDFATKKKAKEKEKVHYFEIEKVI